MPESKKAMAGLFIAKQTIEGLPGCARFVYEVITLRASGYIHGGSEPVAKIAAVLISYWFTYRLTAVIGQPRSKMSTIPAGFQLLSALNT